ncbi:hypothetical protein [Rosistilla oblonga]|uniref:hypothetical protein n=1 Tax=Rosistilla oblonga TaxID=2527990 RepID=UPI003A971292
MTSEIANLPPSVDLHALIALFYDRSEELGEFTQQPAEALPPAYQQLLAHHAHMTVTVERFHDSLVDVHVHRTDTDENRYAREITLARQSDGEVVQYGIVRLNHEYLEPQVWKEIASEEIPLGRVLIQHNVLREVVLEKLWRVRCAPPLARFLNVSPGDIVYGRTAMIFCNKEPAIELLEIVVA